MKKNLIAFGTTMFLLSLLFHSCRKMELVSGVQSNLPTELDTHLTLKAAKVYYDSVNVTSTKKTETATPNSLEHIQHKYPHFDQGVEIETGNSYYVELPMSYDVRKAMLTPEGPRAVVRSERERILNASFDRLIVYRSKAASKLEMMVVSYIPDRTAVGKFSSEVKSNRLGKLDRNFTGWIIYQKLDGTKMFGIRIIYGQAVKRIKFHGKRPRPEQLRNIKKANSGGYEICEVIEWVGYTVYCIEKRPEMIEICEWVENGEYWTEENCVYVPGDTECFTGDCENDTDGRDVDNGENGKSDIVTNLDNTCLNNVWKKLRANLNAEFTHMLTGTFEVNDHINFIIDDGRVANNANAQTVPSRPPHTGSNGITYFDVKVTLNDKTLPSYSQEYVATVILHEVMHAYMEENKIYYQNQFMQHREMFYAYLENMRDALQRFNGDISDQEGIILALDGMKDFIITDPELYDLVLQFYHIDTYTAISTTGKYKDKTRGTSTGCE
ncbi:hypothetical protein LLH06_00450 [Mucilaginibacter daejeonensis]|uniref:hypothetical protein n=1 Tax=Mucilaginibacter daejeonensis TaxID=398049 RepID=UPI001D17AB52|nr:hypothetical protein [Mucilaginibacter daejeonensis]UEG53447.1 hypothetical protein LLH06_00450 [Mucilaginibacter daejeonensis]